jgi:mannitol-1-/sugar-/sorbitol-6-phosphatase
MRTSPTAQFECSAILFDLDGVLVDSTKCIEDTWRTWAKGEGLDPFAVVQAAHGRRAIETIQLMAPLLDAIEVAAKLAAHEASATEGVCEVPGARALLDKLPPTGWAVVTSAIRAVANHRLRLARLPMPCVMVCAEDVANGKPNAEGYLSAATQLGCTPEDCIVVEDAPAGLTAARSAGMRAIAITTTHSRQEMSDAALIVPGIADLTVHLHHRDHGTRLQIDICRELRASR